MSVQTYHLHPTVHYCTDTLSRGPGTHTAAGAWTESSGDCSSACDDLFGSLDETDHSFLRSSSTAGAYNPGRFEHDYSAPPAGITVSKVRVVAYLRTSNGGPAAIDESPRVKGFVTIGGTRYYQTGPTYVTVTNPCNRQTSGPTATYTRYVCGEWSVNPATAIGWTLADLAAGIFRAGVEAGGVAEGQAGNGVPPTTGGSSASLDAALIDVEVEGTPADLVIDPLRQVISRHLRLRRRPRRAPVKLPAAGRLLNAAAGDTAYVDDPRWPAGSGSGAGAVDWDARPVFITRRSESPLLHTGELEGEDLREVYADFWSPLHTDLAADDQWTGIAWVDRGGGKTVARAQGGWILRPNDFLLRDAASGKWRITPWGLMICGGTASGLGASSGETTWHLLNSTFSQGTGGEGTSLPNADTTGATSWTVGKSGTATVVVKADSSFLLDVSGYRRAIRITNGAPYASNLGNLTQAVAGFTTTQRVRVGIKFRMVSGNPANLRFLLRRTTAPTDWNESTQAWAAAAVRNTLASGGAGKASFRLVGDHYEYWTSDITVGGAGAQTLTVEVGSIAQDNAAADIFAVSLISTGAATGAQAPVIRREFLATQGTALTQAFDEVTLDNQADYRVYQEARGTLTAMAVPLWDHEDLPDGARKYLIGAKNTAGPVFFDVDTIHYHRIDATTGEWVFDRTVNAGASSAVFPVSSSSGTLPRYLTAVKLSARRTSSAGDLGLTALTLSLFVNGVKGTDAVGLASILNPALVALGRGVKTSGATDTCEKSFDGILAHLEIVPFCLTDAEIARRHAQLSLPALPAAV